MKELLDALKDGKAVFGYNTVTSKLRLELPKKIILANDCPAVERQTIEYYSKIAEVPVEILDESVVELGSICGKPYKISTIAILNKTE